MEAENRQSAVFKKPLAIIFLFFLVIITVLIFLYYSSQKSTIKQEANENLIAISDLKSNYIKTWLYERKSDVEFIVNNSFIVNAIYDYNNNLNRKTKEEILEILKPISEKSGSTVRIVNSDLENLITFPETTRDLGGYRKKEIKDIIISRISKTYITDFRYFENSDSLHIDIISPIFLKNDSKPFAVIILEIIPYDFLFNYINEWPTKSETSENLLIEKLGNEVVNINSVKYLKSKPLELRIPLNESENISVKAINGERGIVEGIDYRKVDVVGVIKPIEETNWILISKTDKDEIYGPLKKLTIWFIVFLGSTILSVIVLISLVFIRIKYSHKIHSLNIQKEKDTLQKHYETIIKNANDIFILTTPEGNIIEVNNKALDTYGYTKDEINKLNIKDLRVSEYRDQLDELLEKIKEEKSKVLETIHIKKDGTTFPVEASLRLIEVENKLYIQSIIRDISERKNAELKIKNLNRVYALLSKINETIVRIKDRDVLFDEICKIAHEIGLYHLALIGIVSEKENKIQIKSSSKDSKGIIEKIEKIIAYHNDILYPEKDSILENKIIVCNNLKNELRYKFWGEEISRLGLNACISLPINLRDKVIGVLSLYSDNQNCFSEDEIELLKEVTSDISFALNSLETELEREKVFNELENSEKKFKMVFNYASDAMLLLDYDRIIDCNEKALEIYSLSKEELLTKKPYEISPVKQPDGTNSREKALSYIKAAIDGKPQRFDWLHLRGDGTEFEAEINLNRITFQNKPFVLAIARDITKRKKFENELLLAKQKAEEMNKLKSIFLANMSHELRTPMTGIIGFAEILYDSLTDDTQKKLVDIILKGGKRLTNTLNLILDLSKIEADKVELKLEPVKISSILLETALLFQIAASRKNLNLKTEIQDDVYASLDKTIFEKIISNLVQNAITYTPKGEIALILERESTLSGNYAVIKVKDTGIGIPENKQDIVFEPFRQVSEGYDRFYEGVGLGLTITKKYTELMGGKISLESQVGKGSTFIIKFPETKPSIEKEEKINNTEKQEKIKKGNIKFFPDKKVLLVEDDEENIITIKYILKDICNIDIAFSGYEALSLIKKENYDLILMDIGLKELDGIQTTKIIRQLEKYKNIPIVALTAFAMIGDKERFLEAGCSHYISKPFAPKDLIELVSRLLNT